MSTSGTAGHVDPWGAVHLLADPTRRRLLDAVRAARGPLTRDAAATAAGVSRRLAAFHLDQLAAAGLLEVDYARPPGRSGPGAGRPAKRYRAAPTELAVSVPERRYDLAARLLAAGIQATTDRATDARAGTMSAAAAEGRRVGALRRPGGKLSARRTLACAADALRDLGYQPELDGTRRLRLRNCPFHAVVDVAPDLVCGMNHEFVTGLLAGLDGHPDVAARLAPAPPDCCVTVGPPTAQDRPSRQLKR